MSLWSRIKEIRQNLSVANVKKPAKTSHDAGVMSKKPPIVDTLPAGVKAANEAINALPPVTHPAFDRAALKVSPSLATSYAADRAIVDAGLARDNCAAASVGLDRPRHALADFGIPVARTSSDGAVFGGIKGILGSVAPIKIARAVVQRVAVFVTNNRTIGGG